MIASPRIGFFCSSVPPSKIRNFAPGAIRCPPIFSGLMMQLVVRRRKGPSCAQVIAAGRMASFFAITLLPLIRARRNCPPVFQGFSFHPKEVSPDAISWNPGSPRNRPKSVPLAFSLSFLSFDRKESNTARGCQFPRQYLAQALPQSCLSGAVSLVMNRTTLPFLLPKLKTLIRPRQNSPCNY